MTKSFYRNTLKAENKEFITLNFYYSFVFTSTCRRKRKTEEKDNKKQKEGINILNGESSKRNRRRLRFSGKFTTPSSEVNLFAHLSAIYANAKVNGDPDDLQNSDFNVHACPFRTNN